jgi:hypothetical protein
MINRILGGELINFCEAVKTKSELSEAADSLILKVKTQNDTVYSITLDADYFQEHFNNDFKTLFSTFNISRTNPVKVTRPGMSLLPFCLLFIFLCHCRIKHNKHVALFIY